MPDIIKVYRQSLPAMRFVGKCYGEDDKVNGAFSSKWGEWFGNGWFAPLEQSVGEGEPFDGRDAYCGLIRLKEGEPFQYWIGMFLPVDTAVPDGYDRIDFDAFDAAVCWIYGKEPDLYTCNSLDRVKAEGFDWTADRNGIRWCFERYVCPRFTQPDDQGNVILDMCYYVE